MADTIHASDIEVMCRIGCTEEERSFTQRLLVSIRAVMDTRAVAKSLNLDGAICYRAMCELTRELAAERPWVLVEEFAHELSERLFERFPAADALGVLVKKFALPGVAYTGVEIERNRSARA